MQLVDLAAAEVAAVYDRLGATVDARLCYHPGGRLGPPCGSPLGLLAASARTEQHAAIDGRTAAAVLGLAADVFFSFCGGFADACAGVLPDLADWPDGEPTEAYRSGARIARELRGQRPDLFRS